MLTTCLFFFPCGSSGPAESTHTRRAEERESTIQINSRMTLNYFLRCQQSLPPYSNSDFTKPWKMSPLSKHRHMSFPNPLPLTLVRLLSFYDAPQRLPFCSLTCRVHYTKWFGLLLLWPRMESSYCPSPPSDRLSTLLATLSGQLSSTCFGESKSLGVSQTPPCRAHGPFPRKIPSRMATFPSSSRFKIGAPSSGKFPYPPGGERFEHTLS